MGLRKAVVHGDPAGVRHISGDIVICIAGRHNPHAEGLPPGGAVQILATGEGPEALVNLMLHKLLEQIAAAKNAQEGGPPLVVEG